METQFSRRIQNLRRSAVRDILSFHERSDSISFAGGLPGNQALPLEAMQEASRRVFEKEKHRALQYGTTEGHSPLREWIAAALTREGLPTKKENLLITGGSQQALDLLGRAFLNSGDRVAFPLPVYNGALQAFELSRATFFPLLSDGDGPLPGEVERALDSGVKLFYFMPNLANPSGKSTGPARRREIAEVLSGRSVIVLEDDPYSSLFFEGERGKRLSEYLEGESLLLGSFSKILAPAFRIGYIRAPERIIQKMIPVKQAMDLHTSLISQMILTAFLEKEDLEEHLKKVRPLYRERRDLMISEIGKKLIGFRFEKPEGGVFLWGGWEDPVDSSALLPLALEEGVAFVPGNSFFPEGGHRWIRLNYSFPEPDRIVEGIGRLARARERLLSAGS